MIWVEGVAPAVGACMMWKEVEDGGRVWITCPEDEAEECEGGSPVRRWCFKQGVKVSTWKGRQK